MSTNHKWASPESVTTVLSTELNSLANNGAAVAVSAAIDNSAGLYKYADFEAYTSQTLTNGDYHTLMLLEAEDNTNFEDGVLSSGEALLPAAQLLGNVRLKNGGFERHVIRQVLLPATKFKVMLLNFASGALAASGNLVRMVRYSEQDL
jgi:hypothetical protein